MSLKRLFVPKSDVKQRFTTTQKDPVQPRQPLPRLPSMRGPTPTLPEPPTSKEGK